VYKHALNGFSVEMSEADAEAMSQDYRVALVEEDGIMTADATQTNPPWGLDRIDQRNLPLNATYNYNWTGSGVRVYVIDTGIRTTHNQFGGRASMYSTRLVAAGRIATVTARTSPVLWAVRLTASPRARCRAEFGCSTVTVRDRPQG
jgi:subtilisin family serine protease